MSLSAGIKLLFQHARIVQGTTVANWNTGIATSGAAGGDLFTYGVANKWWRLSEAYLVIFPAFNVASHVTLRAYFTVAGAERTLDGGVWDCDGTDGGLATLLWFWEIQMFGPLRLELYSDNVLDNGFSAVWEYRVKDW